MTRLEAMCRTAVNWAPIWGTAWAVDHVRTALLGDGDSTTWERSRQINRRATLGARLVQLRDQIPEIEKQARRTPAKTLKKEWEKVAAAKVLLVKARAELAVVEPEWRRLVENEETYARHWRETHLRGET